LCISYLEEILAISNAADFFQACLYKEGTLKAKLAELIRENFDEVTALRAT
jgi:hypothetical protein